MAPQNGKGRKERPACDGLTELFYGDQLDLRDEIGRTEREEIAKSICHNQCVYRFSCLEFALLQNQDIGVWGGMSQGERREFKIWLRKQGYKELPQGAELRLNVNLYEGHDGAMCDGPRLVYDRNGASRAQEQESPDTQPPANQARQRKTKTRRRTSRS